MPYPIGGKIYIECRRCSRKIKGKERKIGEKIVLVFDCYRCGNHWQKEKKYLERLIDSRSPQKESLPSTPRKPRPGPREMALECLRSAMPGSKQYGDATIDERLERAHEYAKEAGTTLEKIAEENNIDLSIIT